MQIDQAALGEAAAGSAPAQAGDWPARDLFAVASYFSPTEAHIVLGCLQAAGIPAVLADANLVQTNSLWTAALGGVRILVPERFMVAAQCLLAAHARGELALGDDADPGAA